MLTVTVDLPTPPLPEATASTRVVAGSWTPRTSAPPRSWVVSAARSSGDMTSNSSDTEPTPGNDATCSCTWSSKLERSGQPTTVSAIVTVTALAVDPHVANHAELGHGLAQLGVDHPAERLQDLLVRRHHAEGSGLRSTG